MMIGEDVIELGRYAEDEGTEVGEAAQALLHAWGHTVYYSDEFEKALEKEMKATLQHFRDNFVYVEEEETKVIKYKTLMHVSEL